MTATQEMELWLGPGQNGSSFESDEHRRAMWFRYRDKVMRQWGNHGRRPYAWWYYESAAFGVGHGRHPGVAHERSILFEFPEFASVLTPEERVELEREWRRQFDRSFDEHFFFCAGPGKIFTGDIARELHWLWADIPPPLLDQLMAERQRRGRVVRKLEEEGAPAEATAEDEDHTGKH
jgi:hypothetical protein